MSNPLLESHRLPPFSSIQPEHVKPAIESLLERNRERIASLLAALKASGDTPTWAALVAPLEQWDDELSQAWSPVGHLNGVLNTDELREAYNACLPLLCQYSTELGQNIDLCNAYKALQASDEFDALSQQQKTTDRKSVV